MSTLSHDEQQELLLLLEEQKRRQRYRLFDYTLTGDNAKAYPKHCLLMNKTAEYPIVTFFGANRVGKTIAGAKWVTILATGMYPEGYTGARFDKPVNILCIGRQHAQVKEVIQKALLGDTDDIGSGMIQKDRILDMRSKQGVSGGVERITVQWQDANGKVVKGANSHIVLMASEQGKEALEGMTMDAVWIDEECSMDVFNEALTRCFVSGGIIGEKKRGSIFITMTPDHGFTDLMQKILPIGEIPYNNVSPIGAYVEAVSMYDVPHISAAEIEALKSRLQHIYIRPKIYGLPEVGAGSVYPIPEETYLAPFEKIPDSWERTFSLDPGRKNIGIVWAAKNPNTGVITVYDEWLQYEFDDLGNLSTPATIPASIIRNRGKWMVGACDPAAEKMKSDKNFTFLTLYRNEGVMLIPANNAVELGIDKVYQAFLNGTLRVMENCRQLRTQLRLLRRDDRGDIVKVNDHLPDALRYLMMAPSSIWQLNPAFMDEDDDDVSTRGDGTQWY